MSESSAAIVENLLNCAVCLDQFENPKILPCHHSFCEKCIKLLPRETREGKQVVCCPTCRKETNTIEIQSSFVINNLLELSRVSSSSDAIGSQSLDLEECPDHSMPLSTYCKDCSLTVCTHCAVQKHRKHEVVFVSECYKEEIKPIQEQMGNIKKVVADVETACEALVKVENDIADQVKEVQELVNTTADELVRKINEQREKLLQQARNIAERKLAMIKTQREEASETMIQLKTAQEKVETLLQEETPQQILHKKSHVMKELESSIGGVQLEYMVPLEKPDMKYKSKQVNLQQPFATIEASLIHNHFTIVKSPCKTHVFRESDTKKVIVKLRYTGSSALKPSTNMISGEAKLQGKPDDAIQCKVADARGKLYDISFTPTSAGTHEANVTVNGELVHGCPVDINVILKRRCRNFIGMRSSVHTKAIAAARNDRYKIIMTKKSGLCEFGMNVEFNHLMVRRVYPEYTSFSKIAIANDGSMFTIDEKYWQVKKLDSLLALRAETKKTGHISMGLNKNPCALTIHRNGDIYVVGYTIRSTTIVKSLHILILDPRHLSCEREYELPLDKQTRPSGIALDSQDNIFITDEYYSCFYKFDKKKGQLITFSGKGSNEGQLDSPLDIAIDKNDLVYIADAGNNRISVFQTDGVFLMCLESAEYLQVPSSIAICNDDKGTILVSGTNGIAIF